jgi:hypothetical protein
MTSIAVEQVVEAALQVLDGAGQCRAQAGPIKKPFTVSFEFGRWRGRVTTCYSAPEFYARLCAPDALMGAPDARELPSSEGCKAVSVRGIGDGLAERLVVKRCQSYGRRWPGTGAPGGTALLRAEWEAALARTLEAGRDCSGAFPVCYMEKRKGRHRDALLITEQVPDVAGAGRR